MANPLTSTSQFGRTCTLLVSDSKGKSIDLSAMRIKFSVKKSNGVTPNVADIRVYNLAQDVVSSLTNKLFTKVTLQAGYQDAYGVIFQGNIKQALNGRESATDTFVDIISGDGDRAYNFAIVNKTIAAGATQMDQLQASIASFAAHGVSEGYIKIPTKTKFPRGKVMWGNARDYIQACAASTDTAWSIQDEQVVLIPRDSYQPGQVVVMNSVTGMIGTPQQTVDGVNLKCLLNPKLKINTRVQVDEASVQKFKIDFSVPGSASSIPLGLTADGVYYIQVVNHTGDNRGTEWYSTLGCLNIYVAKNILNSVPAGY